MTSPHAEFRPDPGSLTVAHLDVDARPSIVSHVAAGVFSFLLLVTLGLFPSNSLTILPATLERGWLLAVDLLPYNAFVDAFIGAVALMVVAAGVEMVQRIRRFPAWLPLALAWPSALMLVGPSAVALPNDGVVWLVVGATLALVFSAHWLCLLSATEVWD